MAWYYERSGEAVGPVTDEDFGRLVADGSVGPATLVWREGMANWQAHGEVQAAGGAAAPPAMPAAPGAATAICHVCGGVFPADQVVTIAGATVCAACKPVQLQHLQQGSAVMAGGLWRSGQTLVASKDAKFPERCVHCGGTTDLRRLKKRLYWHHPAIYVSLLAGVLIYVILALVLRKNAAIEISLCGADRTRRTVKIAVAWILWLAFLISFPVLGVNHAPDWMWLLPPLLLIAAVVASLMARLVYARKIDEKHVWIRGICPAYLADLPQWTGN